VEGRPAELTGSSVVVRAATVDDVALLGDIERAAGERFRTIGMDAIADDDPPPAADLVAAVDDGRLWVAELDGSVVGYVLAVDLDGWPHLEQVSVHPDAAGRGVGRALVEQVATWAQGRGPWLTLSTFRDVAWNAPWYGRLGFEVVPEVELDDRLRDVRRHEHELGLDVSARVIMRRPVD
jgi:GNAT superfamily N-acetyltransferase